ncbi:mycothione reductase [Rhodococcus aerolatus]
MPGVRHFDLAVIGTGSANSILDERFDDLDVALLEEGTFGGTCLNVGCIPTKMFVYASEVAATVRDAHRLGVDAHVDGVRWTDVVTRVFGRIDPISAGGERYRTEGTPNTTVYRGHATFTGERTIDTGTGETITADRVVVAAGSRPVVPAVVRDSGVPFHTNEDVMRLPELPRSLVILGGGYIASEFAHVFADLGTRVTLVVRGPQLLRHHDSDVAERFTALAAQRWDVRLGRDTTAVAATADGGVRLTLDDGSTAEGDALLVATGRVPNGDELLVEKAGIELHEDGRVKVDEQQRTTAEGVWALGDISSPHMLKHVANHEAKVVQHNLLHPEDPRTTDHRFVPAAVFTHPQIAAVGMTEAQARDAGLDVAVKVQAYGDVAYGWAMEDTQGFCKVVAEKGTGRLLGAHVMGAQAPTVIQPLIQAMAFGQTALQVARGQYWIHPGLPEVVENALLGLEL